MKLLVGILILGLVIGAVVWIRLAGPFRAGNHRRYSFGGVKRGAPNALTGRTVLCLGSSVTRGLAAGNVSFADYIARRSGCNFIKEAVSASTLAGRGRRSYIARLERHPAVNRGIDCFLCQLSTNDATFKSDPGDVSDSFDIASFDTGTTVGAMEYIIAFAKKTWDCPVVFFTGTKYDNPRYHRLVNLLLELRDKWGIEVIDLWHNREMNRVSPDDYKFYMNDGVHPTKAGYLEWWTPVIEENLCRILEEWNERKGLCEPTPGL